MNAHTTMFAIKWLLIVDIFAYGWSYLLFSVPINLSSSSMIPNTIDVKQKQIDQPCTALHY